MRRSVAQLASLDLNLLLMLRELLRERNVTRAAERVGVTQPAASAALRRLRRHFGDELLVRVNRGYVLSPLAVQLERQVESVCAAVEQLFATGAEFNPATSLREFTLLAADYTIAVVGERLSRMIASAAPRASLHIRLVRESLAVDMPHIARFVDGIVAPPVGPQAHPHLRSADLFTDRWVCVVSAGSRAAEAGTLSLDDLAKLSWVVPYHRDQPGDAAVPPIPPVSRQLALLGIRPRVAVRVESYQAVPQFITGTGRVALMQERLVRQFADRLDLRVFECPGEPEPIVESLWWHEDWESDPAHTWFREAIIKLARDL
jgi:DNA-binding transcriptional LysR family regulator